jgi:hypothetical protein
MFFGFLLLFESGQKEDIVSEKIHETWTNMNTKGSNKFFM